MTQNPYWPVEFRLQRGELRMALLLFFAPPGPLASSSAPHSSFSSSATTLAVDAATISRLYIKPIDLCSNSLGEICFDKLFSASRRGGIIAKVSLDVEETGQDGEMALSESDDDDEENIPFVKIPLESNLQLKLEQKMRMKVAKKVRLRRKKLIRKRRTRKKGQWPPSKMKKLKNV
ncbi:hypothetical protein HS088_TW03G00667 [Tripterygium wilfordii]|uniref:Uncharacterized protein n=1 Tax=Tripterygium wilfordii TaxID=458696 RepID=A0A7J7DVK3_TRIWF|nr:50S ribosomal protein 5 alpha, chloroplastic-like [Tripterygium wilfordii]KAF5750331.1 hypothetical protein HS088_TW03G00667 [Tripterygium wilfordii]